jgi:hypothetical protein
MPKRPKPAREQKWPEVCSLPEPPAFEVVEARGRFPSFGAKRCQTICRARGCRRWSSGAERDTAGPPHPGRGGAPRGGDPKIVHDHLRAARLASDSGPSRPFCDRLLTAAGRPERRARRPRPPRPPPRSRVLLRPVVEAARERPEAAIRGAVPTYRPVEVVRISIGLQRARTPPTLLPPPPPSPTSACGRALVHPGNAGVGAPCPSRSEANFAVYPATFGTSLRGGGMGGNDEFRVRNLGEGAR